MYKKALTGCQLFGIFMATPILLNLGCFIIFSFVYGRFNWLKELSADIAQLVGGGNDEWAVGLIGIWGTICLFAGLVPVGLIEYKRTQKHR